MYIFILCFTEKSKDNKMYKKVINVLPRTNSVVFRNLLELSIKQSKIPPPLIELFKIYDQL